MIFKMKSKVDTHAITCLLHNIDYEVVTNEQWDDMKKIDPRNSSELIRIFEDYVVPDFESMGDKSKKGIKDNLYSALSSNTFDFQEILRRLNFPFNPIEDAREFFLILWRALFKENFKGP